jgi:hypothetical protein
LLCDEGDRAAIFTGIAYLMSKWLRKRPELLHEFVPAAKSIALLVNPTNPLETRAALLQRPGGIPYCRIG